MAWDPALLRKFNATGHFRLLNQVRSELKANPIKRAAPSAADQASSRGVATGKPLDLRSQGYGRRRSSSGSSASASPSTGLASSPAKATPSPSPAPLPAPALPETPANPDTTAAAVAEPSPWGRRRFSTTAAVSSAPAQESGIQFEGQAPADGDTQPGTSSPVEAGSRSFRDRLNAIQMR